MNISEFQKKNELRAIRWHKGGDWNLLEWAGAMCGEAGECANVAKKIKRLDTDLPNREAGLSNSNRELLMAKMADETADTIIYGIIILSRLGVDASMILADKFDQKSIEYGFPERAPR